MPDKALKEEELILTHSVMVKSSMMKKPWKQEHEINGHIASAAGKQKEMNTGGLSYLCSLGPQPMQ